MFIEGLVPLSPMGYVIVTLVLTHITVVGVTVFLHRHQAHRALTMHPAVSHFFRLWIWLTTAMLTREWVAVHRKHHAKCETPDDPHSPQTRGIAKVLFSGVSLYEDAARDPETCERYGKGTPDDWIERNLYSRYRYLGLATMFVIDVVLFGWVGLIIFTVQMLWMPVWAAGIINGIGHFWGYRNFETRDASRNIVPIGFLIGGEELHNNHHAYRQSARLSNKWWEFDIGWMYIRLLEMAGLARVKRAAPKTSFLPTNDVFDTDAVTAMIRNRFHVLKLYGARVVRPVLRVELGNSYASGQLRRLKRWMTREDLSLDERQRATLDEALADSATLKVVLEFKQQLRTLLEPNLKDGARLASLRAWCANAEATGIEALREFAGQLRGYRMSVA